MWKSSFVLVLRSSNRSFNCRNLHYPLFYGISRATSLYFNPFIITSLRSIVIPCYATYFTFSRDFSTNREIDNVGNDVRREISVKVADFLHNNGIENVGLDEYLEKPLDRVEIELGVTKEIDVKDANFLHNNVIKNGGFDKIMEKSLDKFGIKVGVKEEFAVKDDDFLIDNNGFDKDMEKSLDQVGIGLSVSKEIAVKDAKFLHNIVIENSGFDENMEQSLDKVCIELGVTKEIDVKDANFLHDIVIENNGFDENMKKSFDNLVVGLGVSKEVAVKDADFLHNMVIENAGFDKNMEETLDQAGIGLTTELVVETLHRLRFEEKVSFRFFMWAANQENYQHEYRVYNEMIDILSSTKFRIKQFGIVCDVLDYMKRNDKKSVPIEVLMTILRKYTEKHMTEVLKCSSKKKKRSRVKKLPEINAFNLLLDALCKCGLVENAEILFKKLKRKVAPNAVTFNTLFFGWCRVRNPKRGMKVLEEMTNMGFTPDSFTYNAAIDTFCKAGMVNKAVELFEFMKSKNSVLSPPTAKTYAMMILAFVNNDRIEDSFRVVGDMIQSGCLPDVFTYKELIEGMCLAGKVEEAYKFLEEMAKKGYPPDIVTYNCFLKVLCDNKKADEALRLYGRMVEMGCIPSVHSFNMMLEMFLAMGDSDGAFDTWNEMDKKGCDRDANTYCMMIEGLFSCKKIEDACLLLEDVVKRGIKLPYQKFDLFLKHLSDIGDLRGIQCLSEHMKTFYNPAMARRYALGQKRKSLSLRG